jgi:hypothetical protein
VRERHLVVMLAEPQITIHGTHHPRIIPRLLLHRPLRNSLGRCLCPAESDHVRCFHCHRGPHDSVSSEYSTARCLGRTSKGIQRAKLGCGVGVESRISNAALSGAGKFRGHILYGGAYINPTPFTGRRVLVVGMRNTGAEIASTFMSMARRLRDQYAGGSHRVRLN